MAGVIGFPCSPISQPGQIIGHGDTQTRYRILRVDGMDASGITCQIVGVFEPIASLQRSQGLLLAFKGGVLEHMSEPIEDNTMSQHLLRVIQYFGGTQPNPYSPERALGDVVQLRDWALSCWDAMDDSNNILGQENIARARQHDSLPKVALINIEGAPT